MLKLVVDNTVSHDVIEMSKPIKWKSIWVRDIKIEMERDRTINPPHLTFFRVTIESPVMGKRSMSFDSYREADNFFQDTIEENTIK